MQVSALVVLLSFHIAASVGKPTRPMIFTAPIIANFPSFRNSTASSSIPRPLTIRPLIYQVPGTLTALSVYLHSYAKIPRGPLYTVLHESLKTVETAMAERHARGPLPSAFDPFTSAYFPGCTFSVCSIGEETTMTWELLRDTLKGVWQVVYVERRDCAAVFEVRVAGVEGMVGKGAVFDSS